MKKLILIAVMLCSFSGFAKEKESKSFEETLMPYVEKILKGVEQGVGYAAEEIPEVLTQYVTYHAVYAWLWVVIGLVVIVFNRRMRSSLFKLKKSDDSETRLESVEEQLGSDAVGFYIFTVIVSYIVGIIMVLVNISTAIQATFFPKLYLVERFIELF